MHGELDKQEISNPNRNRILSASVFILQLKQEKVAESCNSTGFGENSKDDFHTEINYV